MKMRLFFMTLIFITALSCFTNSWAAGYFVHDFACDNCHKADADLKSLAGNVCLGCHSTTSQVGPLAHVEAPPEITAKEPSKIFEVGMASDAMGSRTAELGAVADAPGFQSSHNWAASDTNPAAGASAPSSAGFYGGQNYSGALVSCSRCHDPHGSAVTYDVNRRGTITTVEANPKLLKLGVDSEDAMCVDCHAAWDLNNNDGKNPGAYLTHPMVSNYPTFQSNNPTKYKPFNPDGDMALAVNGDITCTTCHGTHFADSDAATTDGAGQTLSVGDGSMLKGNGRMTGDAISLCTSCHVYKGHGATNVGCIDCHSGHSYNSGTPNFFVLRDNVSLAAFPADAPASPGTNLAYTSATGAWKNAGDTGYCQGCHATLPGTVSEHASLADGSGTALCGACHAHYDPAAPNDPAFVASGSCDTCHGKPPVIDTASGPNGYAVDGVNDYSGDANYKSETDSAHAKHAGGTSPEYAFACADCHAGNAHNDGTFQDVFNVPNSFSSAAGALSPGYVVGSGTCSAVYCHSNGGARAAAPVAATVPVWENGGTTTCTSCHGKDAATMATAGNSSVHQDHLGAAGSLLGKSYGCAVCHSDTATDANTLAAGAIQGTHVNNAKDVASNMTVSGTGAADFTYDGTATGTCSVVYCHSDGNNVNGTISYTAPDWDAGSATCTFCHNNGTDDGVVANAAPATGAHAKHVVDSDGPQLSCTTCHTNDGTSGTVADHINGYESLIAGYQTAVCDSCHGVDGAEVAPAWNTAGSDDCLTCHTGTLSTINTQAPDKSDALDNGHNASGSYASGNVAPSLSCEACHDKAATHLTGSGNMRLQAGFDCTSCHDTMNKHQAISCTSCHDPHGTTTGSANLYMVKKTSAGNYSGTVAFTATIGGNSYDEADSINADDICATCHSSASGTTHNNQENTGIHSGGNKQGEDCFTCHLPHFDATPFSVGAGTSCDGCHGFPPATAAHLVHDNNSVNTDAEDLTDCANCHTGADSYTYGGTGDQPGLNHGDAAGRDTILFASVGFNAINKNCANACHTASVANNGVWLDISPGPLACDACHYYELAPTSANNIAAGAKALAGTHNAHFAADKTCADCHSVPIDLAHISPASTPAADLSQIQDNAAATQEEADILGALGTDNDPGQPNCSNVACHNPSNDGYSATWNGPAADCDTCHSSTDPATSNHSAHLASATNFGRATACNDCHINNGVNTAHLDGTVQVTGTRINTYTDTASTCANDCHQNGVNAAPVTAVNWDMAAQADCTICHTLQAAGSGSHDKHIADGATCASCHDNTSQGTSAATQHLDLDLDVFNTVAADLGYPADKALATGPATCNAAACHTDGRNAAPVVTPDWGTNSACVECHTTMTNNGPATGGSHAAHMTTGMASIACTSCHAAATNPATDTLPSAAHRDGNVDTNAALEYGVSPFTNKAIGSAFTTCAAASCHDNGLNVAVATPVWGVANNDCSACHLTQPGTGKHAIHLGHTSTAIPAIDCNDCHAGAVEGSTPPTTGHFDGNVDVVNGYPTNVAKGMATWTGTCSTASCHTDGQSGDADSGASGPSVVTTLAWNDAGTCGACHVAVPTSAKHTSHLTLYGSTCGDCHATAGNGSALPTANHLNNNIDVAASTNYTAAGAPGNGWGTCADPNTGCHGTPEARVWDAGIPVCNTCHGQSSVGTGEPLIGTDKESTLPLGQHNTHVNAEGMGCADCHDGGHFQASTQDDKIQISFTGLGAGGSYNPPTTWTAGKWLYDQTSSTGTQDCSNLYCHSNGQAADGGAGALSYATPDWGDVTTGQCGTCHLGDGVSGDATTIATGSHTAHVVKSGYACDDCHLGNTHVNNALEVTAGTYTSAVLGNGYGTCSTASCHDDGTGALKAPTDTWGTAVTDCTECHAGAAIASGSHTIHLGSGATCTDCHASGTNPAAETAPSAGHRNDSIDTLAGLAYGNSTKGGTYSTCATASCHITNRNTAGLTPVWGGAAITDCTECHTTPPTGDTHNTHINAKTNGMTGLTIGCTDCHDAATDVAGQAPPAAGHQNDVIDAAGGYPAKAIANAAYLNCTTAACHQTGQSVGSFVVTSNFNVNDTNCTQCHEASPTSGSHAKHITATGDCATCHTAAVIDVSYGSAAHGNGSVNVDVETNSFTKAYGSTAVTCATISCHGDGLNAGGSDTPQWGGSAGCAACHNDDETVPTALVTGSHDEHLGSTIKTGIACADCHIGAIPSTGSTTAIHGNGTIEAIGYATANAGIGSGSWTTCSTVACHEDGTVGSNVTTPAWGANAAACTECHAAVPTTNAHGTHLGLTGVNCATCHTGALVSSNPGANHLNGSVDVLFSYTDSAIDATFGSCTTSCHGDGKSGAGTTPAWNGSITDCNACHVSTPAGLSHTAHMTDTVLTIGCGDCHAGATKDITGGSAHVDGNIDTIAALGYPQNTAYGAANSTCATVSCHDDGTGTPAALTPVWDAAVASCTACHAAAPTTGAHTAHLIDPTNYILSPAIVCDSCHVGAIAGSNAGASHRDGNVDVASAKTYNALADNLGYPALNPLGNGYASCDTAYCHGVRMPKASVSTGLNYNANPNWGDAPTGTDCEFCHDMAPLDVGAHSGVAANQCINCHGAGEGDVNSAGDGFTNNGATHVNGVLNGGGDNCNDCHSSIGGAGNGGTLLSAAHAAHVTTAYVGQLSTNDYGNAANGWYKYTSNAGVYDIGCGYCHPSTVAGHTTKQVSLDPTDAGAAGTVKAFNGGGADYDTTTAGKCSSVYCHSNGADLTVKSPDWFTGTIGGSDCAACHTNAPSTGAHSVHTVGIHYTDLYDSDRAGVMQAASATNAAHGNAATATTITCALCHSLTVSVPQNDQELLCATCHGGSAALKGNLAITGNATHINGTADVQFDLAGFKTTAQLRDDITGVTELNNNWTRPNGYKQIAGDSFDAAKLGATYDGGGSCSTIVCHNGGAASWSDPVAGNCQKCHTELPQ